MNSNRYANTAAIVGAVHDTTGMPSGKHGIGDRARRDTQDSRARMLPTRSTDEKIAVVTKVREYQDLKAVNPFGAADFARAHARELSAGWLVIDSLREAAPVGVNVSPADAITYLEATRPTL